MTTTPSMLGPYPVERELGRGGMGVVYLARDPKLNRQVAIKVLPDALALNAESLARFDREAKLLASLNHPNIAAIYGIEEANQQQVLVLEYVPGETLAARLQSGPLPVDEAVDVCRQIAMAIESAHESGVIHRDLKPGNVKITPDGQVKVLDFGLAKGAGPAAGSSPDLALSPTLTFSPTVAGVILGTAGYMSPEQARGKPVDRRTDIWSFGCVLFECLTGRRIFDGETASDTIARIIERDPDWTALPPATPARLRELLRRCLEKDVRKRQRDIGDARIELEEIAASRSSAPRIDAASPEPSRPAPRSFARIAWAAGLLGIGAAAGIAAWIAFAPPRSSSGGRATTVRSSVAIPPTIRATYGGFTRSGTSVLVLGHPVRPDGTVDPLGRVYVRRLDEFDFKPIPGTEGAESYYRSPDDTWLAVRARVSEQSSERRLLKVPVDGTSPPVALADWKDTWRESLAWLPDGDLLVLIADGMSFLRIPSGGGQPQAPVAIDLGGVTGFPAFGQPLPGGRAVILSLQSWNAAGYAEDLFLLDPRTGKARTLLDNAGSAQYVTTGHIVFSRGDALMAVPFDLTRLAIAGEVTGLASGLRTNTWDHARFEVSSNGDLLYAPGGRLGADRRVVVIDAAGTVTPFGAERRPFEESLHASADGRRVTVVVPSLRGTYETWLADRNRPGLTRVVALPSADCTAAVWSPDGQRLAFTRIGHDKDDGLYVQRVDGAGKPQAILKSSRPDEFVVATAWARDGSGVLAARRLDGKGDIVFVPVSPSGEAGAAQPIRATRFDETQGRFSPDGRFIAYVSDESGQYEVYVASYSKDGTVGPPLVVSSGGGVAAAWAGDGRRLFYQGLTPQILSVTIQTTPALSASAPTIAYDLKKLRLRNEWDILPGGALVAIQNGEGEDDVTSLNLVQNWTAELRARMSKGSR